MSNVDHPWLRRVSEYHSGDVSEAERIAVEAHLATCAICRRALADYRRLYALARSPLRLGLPSQAVMRTPMQTSTPRWGSPPPERNPESRQRLFIGLAASLAAVLVIGGFLAVFATRSHTPSGAGTPVASSQPTVSPSPVVTVAPSPSGTVFSTPPPGSFVCANPSGSSMVYAFTSTDGQVYWVQGCSTPRQLTHEAPEADGHPRTATAIAWSPSNRYLAIMGSGADQPPFEGTISIADTQAGTVTPTQYHLIDLTPTRTADREFIGWLDDGTFVGAVTQNVASGVSPVTIVLVNALTQAETPVTTVLYAAEMEVRAGNLFYGGYNSAAEATQGAHLHRVDLTTGVDTTFVNLGYFGDGGCQAYGPCNWTAPWDVSPNGQQVIYHNPGAGESPSATNGYQVPATPTTYCNLDGSHVQPVLGGILRGGSLTTPLIAPNNRYVLAIPDSGSSPVVGILGVGGESVVFGGDSNTWRTDSGAVVSSTREVNAQYPDGIETSMLDFITDDVNAEQTTQALALGTSNYVWGN